MSVQHEEHNELIEDICYLEHLISAEKQDIKARMLARIGNADSIEDKVDVLSDEIAHTLATMSARIQIVEKTLVSGTGLQPIKAGGEATAGFNVEPGRPRAKVDLLETVKLSIADIAKRNNLYGLQHDSKGLPFCAIRPDTEINFVLPVARNKTQTLAVNLLGESDESLMKKVEFSIDGHQLPHKLKIVEGTLRLICYLPRSKTKNKTYVSIVFPKATADADYIVKLSDVNCVPKLSVVDYLKKQAKR
ncbi:hypothetical protein FLM48_14020 [Shewanella sp. Scap07]|uniref:hypothetical protein n=1 Tax=Shewanella sp. Scap07 TaxID=2589987 RepID=UPI0015BE3F0F|nr:hypothetical protein [Shewanella sp. Scap07]QLE86083.1 hypothetical protein FLM48_14020 [Shewanella sp. Scap07]